MRSIFRTWAIFLTVARRVVAQPGLASATFAGLLAAVALTMSIPIYANAVYNQTFLEKLQSPATDSTSTRPPFAFMFYYRGSWVGEREIEDVAPIDQYLTNSAAGDLGLPLRLFVRHYRTTPLDVFAGAATASKYPDAGQSLLSVRFSSTSGFEDNIILREGAFPAAAVSPGETPVGVLVSKVMADETGMQVGDAFTVRGVDEDGDVVEIPVQITGVWEPIDPYDDFWFVEPNILQEHFIVPEDAFIQQISPHLAGEVSAAIWYLVMDGSRIDYSDTPTLLRHIGDVERAASALLPDIWLAVSPREDLLKYQDAASTLTIQLVAFGVPIIGLLLAFIGLTSTLTVLRRRNEITAMRSRGATYLQVIGTAALEGLLLGAAALLAGAPLSLAIARVIGQSRSFLAFTELRGLHVTLTASAAWAGLAIVGIALLAQIVPVADAARHTITSYKQERARQLRRPWWQRVWLDALLLIPAAYGTYLLSRQGSLDSPGGSSPLENPLLLLVPALGIFSVTLLFLRLVPVCLSVAVWAAARTKSVAFLMAVRHLARTPSFYNIPLALLALTLSLSAFIASLARTLDQHTHDQAYHYVGADVSFYDFGETGPDLFGESAAGSAQWRFLPVTEYTHNESVSTAVRVQDFTASTSLGGQRRSITLVGIDRFDFPQVAFWRDDFARDSLGALMNALATNANGVLVARDFMRDHTLSVGDMMWVDVSILNEQVELELVIVGSFDLFPTWYPDADAPLLVGNLDNVFRQAGGPVPYSVWLSTDGDVAPQDLNVPQTTWLDAGSRVASAQRLPERQGVFGMLSVGFVAAAVLTVLGFLLYELFSFRQRFIELGVLRAIGLSARQMIALLAWEIAFLVGLGGLIGTLLGAGASVLFIPYLQVGQPTPPFMVVVAWPIIAQIYVLFGLMFCFTLGALVVMLRRMRIFDAIKLGETV